jgi:hypothetical protein
LEELIILVLVNKKDDAKMISRFIAEHPSNLEKLFDQKEQETKNDKLTYLENLPGLISEFNLAYNKPGITYFEGPAGMEKIYNEILRTGENFLLIRTSHEPVFQKEILPIVETFIKKRVAKNIKVTAITPTDVKPDPAKDEKWLMRRFWVDKEKYSAPVEIDIFGNKVAILSFGEELIGMIIESKQIALALRQLFQLATSAASPDALPPATA